MSLCALKSMVTGSPGLCLDSSNEVITYRVENNSRAGHGDRDIKHTVLKWFSRLDSSTKIPIIYAVEKSL